MDAGVYQKMAEKHQPEEIKVLFIGESPPEPTGDILPYFYNPESTDGRGLWNQLNQALDIKKDKPEFLEEFQEQGYFLVDIFPTYEALKEFEEKKARGDEDYVELKADIVKRFSRDVARLNPDKIIFLHKGATKELSLPFPGYGNQENFEKELEGII